MAVTESDFTPTQHNLVLYRGDSVEIPMRFGTQDSDGNFLAGYDLTNVIFAAQIRAKEDSPDVMAEFTIDLDDQTDADTRGKFWVRLSAELAAELIATSTTSTARWDLQAQWPNGTVRTYLKGTVSIGKDTTRV